MTTDSWNIPLTGPCAGGKDAAGCKAAVSCRADGAFFQSFGNPDVLDADVAVEATVEGTSPRDWVVTLRLEGVITVPCDRCMDPLRVAVSCNPSLRVCASPSQGKTPMDGGMAENVEDTLPLGETGRHVDIRQAVYDYACLSIPMHPVHPEGQCNPDALSRLSREEDAPVGESTQTPFSALGQLRLGGADLSAKPF